MTASRVGQLPLGIAESVRGYLTPGDIVLVGSMDIAHIGKGTTIVCTRSLGLPELTLHTSLVPFFPVYDATHEEVECLVGVGIGLSLDVEWRVDANGKHHYEVQAVDSL